MSIGDLKSLIGSLMSQKTGETKPVGNGSDKASNLNSLFEKYVKDHKKEASENATLLKTIVDTLSKMKEARKESKKEKTQDTIGDKFGKALNKRKTSKEEKSSLKAITSLDKTFNTKGSGYTHDIHCEQWLKSIYDVITDMASGNKKNWKTSIDLEKEIEDIAAKKTNAVPAGRSGGGGGGGDASEAEKTAKALNEWMRDNEYEYDVRYESILEIFKTEEELQRIKLRGSKEERARLRNLNKSWEDVKGLVTGIEKNILGLDGSVFTNIFKGALVEETKFIQEARKAAYEIAGVTGESKSLQRQYEAIGETVKLTGADRSEFQKQYLTALKSGVKDQKKAMTLTTTQLNTEKQIGLQAGDLGDTFIEWNNQLRLSDDQTAQIGRGIREVGRNTGLVGEKLRAAVDSSKQFVDQMKKAGRVTASGISNAIGLQAEFQKLGVEEAGSGIQKALSSTTGFYEADDQTKSLLANAASRVGLTGDLINGTIGESNEKIKTLNKGLMETANSLGLGGSNAEEMRKNFENLSDDAKREMNMRFKLAFKMEAGEALNVFEAIENKTKTLAEQLADLNKEKSKNLTLEERATIAEKERGLKLGSSLKVLTALSEASKDADSMPEALAKFGKNKKDLEGDLNALGGDWASNTEAARFAIQSSIDSINEGLRKSGKDELTIDSSRIEKALSDPTALRELTADINKGEQELATAQKAQLDPLTSMDQRIKETNDWLRGISNWLISGSLLGTLGKWFIPFFAGLSLVFGAILAGEKMLLLYFNTLSKVPKQAQEAFTASKQKAQDVYKNLKNWWLKKETDEPATPAPPTPTNSTSPTSNTPAPPASVVDDCCGSLLKINQSILEVLKAIKDCICGSSNLKADEGLKNVGNVTAREAGSDLTPTSVPPVAGAAPAADEALAKSGRKKKPKLSEEEINKRKLAGQSEKERMRAEGIDPAVARSIRRQETKNVKADTALNKIERRSLLTDIKNGKQTTRMIQLQKQYSKDERRIKLRKQKEESAPSAPDTSIFDLDTLMKSGKDMMKAAPAIILLGIGATAIGAAIAFVAKNVLGFLGLDIQTVAETAGSVAILIGGAAAIAAGVSGAAEALEDLGEFAMNAKDNAREIAIGAAALLILSPVMTLLAAGVALLVNGVMSITGIDAAKAADAAWQVAGIIGAAGAIAVGVTLAMAGLAGLGALASAIFSGPQALAALWFLGVGTAALLALTPVVVGLAAAVVWMASSIIKKTFNPTQTKEAVEGVQAIIGGAGSIAWSVLSTLPKLALLGALSGVIWATLPFVYIGAKALLALTPAIVLLGAAIIGLAGIIVKNTYCPCQTKAVVEGTKAIIDGAGSIAWAVLSTLPKLMLLGALAPVISTAVPLMLTGAAALLVLTPAILLLGAAILGMAGLILKNSYCPCETKAIVGGVQALIDGAGSIALSVIAAVPKFMLLGGLAASVWYVLPLLGIAAVALLALTPAILLLGAAILGMAGMILKNSYCPCETKAIVGGVQALIDGAGSIALSVIAAVPKFMLLGGLAASVWYVLPLLGIAAVALLALTPAIMGLGTAIIGMASWILKQTFDPSETEDIIKGVQTIIDGASSIALSIIFAVPKFLLLGAMAASTWLAIPFIWLGVYALSAISKPIVGFVAAVKQFYEDVRFVDPEDAGKMAKEVGEVISSTANVANQILSAKKGMMSLAGADWGFFKSPVTQMEEGAKSLEALMAPVVKFIGSIKKFYNDVATTINPEEAVKMGHGVSDILCGVVSVVNSILEVKAGLMNMQGVSSKGGWGWTSTVDQMNAGAESLKVLEVPVKNFIEQIRNFYNEVSKIIPPEAAKKMGTGISDILGAVVSVVNGIFSVKTGLINAQGASSGGGMCVWCDDAATQMRAGAAALKVLEKPVEEFIQQIKSFHDKIIVIIPPETAKKIGENVSAIFNAVADVTCNIMKAKENLTAILDSGGGSTKKLKSQMKDGTDALNAIMWPIYDYALSIKFFSTILNSVFGGKEKVIPMVDGVINILNEVGLVTNSIIKAKDVLSQAMKNVKEDDIEKVFTKFSNMISKGVINPIENNLSSSKLENVLNELSMVSFIIEEIASLMSSIGQTMGNINPIDFNIGPESWDPIKSMEEKMLKSGDKGSLSATGQSRIMGRSEMAINAAEEKAEIVAMGALKDMMTKQGMGAGAISGIEFDDPEINLEKGLVKVTARWSEESSEAAKKDKKAFDELEASKGGEGRRNVSTTNNMTNNDARQAMMQEKASMTPNKSEVTSPELGEIVSETEEQTEILMEMRDLFEKFVSMLQPKSEISSSTSGNSNSPTYKSGVMKPTNYYRRVTGGVAQAPSRSIVNLGPKSVS